MESARDGFQVVNVRHVIPDDGGATRDLVLKSVYQPAHTVTLVGTGNPPGAADVAVAVERVVASQQAVRANTGTPAPAATFPTPNGPRSLAQIRDELRRTGWGGGSDEDALATYRHTAAAADH